MSANRINYQSANKWEDTVGYSRAVKCGNTIEVSGTVAADETGGVIGKDDAYQQTKVILQKIEAALLQAGSSLTDVVRTRLFVTDITRWQEYGQAHGEVFADIRPCTTMVEVARLIGPDYLIEIEATAIIP